MRLQIPDPFRPGHHFDIDPIRTIAVCVAIYKKRGTSHAFCPHCPKLRGLCAGPDDTQPTPVVDYSGAREDSDEGIPKDPHDALAMPVPAVRLQVGRVREQGPRALSKLPGSRLVLAHRAARRPSAKVGGLVSRVEVIRTDGTKKVHETTARGQSLMTFVQALIGANISDTVNLRDGRVMIVDDLGHQKRLALNVEGTRLYHGVCVPGTKHKIMGIVAICRDEDFSHRELPGTGGAS